MKRSTERILTTHTGSLPRPDELLRLVQAKDAGLPLDTGAYEAQIRRGVAEMVARQVDAGLDVVNDGEASKISYSTYVKDRLTGFEGNTLTGPIRNSNDEDFPEYAARTRAQTGRYGVRMPSCNGPVALRDADAVHIDIANLKAALDGRQVEEAFMTAVSPGQISRFLPNAYYPSHEAYLYALADAMKAEYRAIVEAGLVLQVDCPDLASGRTTQFADATLDEFLTAITLHVEALNYALDGLPPERMRLHLCWGNYEGPHHRDVALQDIVDIVLRARPSGLSFEAANPRHEHEWKMWEEVKLPEGKVLIPGVLDSTTNYVEHPELVAQRIARYADVVGRENVIAGTDCGFGTFAGFSAVDLQITWAKLRAMAEGAKLASQELW